MVSRSNSKSKSHAPGSRQLSNSKPSSSGATVDPLRVSWKQLRKQSPWLKLLRKHQKKGTEAIVSTDGYAALFAQRTGKTWVTGAVLCVERSVVHDVLLVGPLTNLKSTWVKFLTEKLPWYSAHLDLESYIADKKANPEGHRILLLNYEAVTPLLKKLRRLRWDRIVYDEAQRLKNRASRSSRDAGLLAGSADRRLALTGTPIDQNPRDLWAIMRFVKVSIFGNVWKDFEDYFIEKPNIDLSKPMGVIQRQRMQLAYQIARQKAPMREDRIEEYSELISSAVMRISKEDAGIVPAKVKVIEFTLDPQEEKRYRKLEKNMVVKAKGTVIKTPLKITQIGKLQQLTGGHIKDEEGNVIVVGTTKRRLMRKTILKYMKKDEPLVVFCKYVYEVHMLAGVLKRMELGEGAKLWGKVKDIKTDPRRTRMLLDFQLGKFSWIVCQQRTGGVGVDLYRARRFFVYSMGHSFIDYDQMLSRGDFLEQDEPAEFFILAAQKSIDTDIVNSVNRKKSITEIFYDRLTTTKGH